MGCFHREHERGVPVGVAGDAISVMAGVDEELDDRVQAELGGQVEGSVAFVVEVRVLEARGVVLDDALHEDEVVQVDGSAEADADVDPEDTVSLVFGECLERSLGLHTYFLQLSMQTERYYWGCIPFHDGNMPVV